MVLDLTISIGALCKLGSRYISALSVFSLTGTFSASSCRTSFASLVNSGKCLEDDGGDVSVADAGPRPAMEDGFSDFHLRSKVDVKLVNRSLPVNKNVTVHNKIPSSTPIIRFWNTESCRAHIQNSWIISLLSQQKQQKIVTNQSFFEYPWKLKYETAT